MMDEKLFLTMLLMALERRKRRRERRRRRNEWGIERSFDANRIDANMALFKLTMPGVDDG